MRTLTHGLMHVVCEKFTIERVVRQGQQPGTLLVERLAHPQRAVLRAGPVGGLAEAPGLGLRVEVVLAGQVQCGLLASLDVRDGPRIPLGPKALSDTPKLSAAC